MSEYVFKLPDLGEGTVEAEIIEWHVKPGDVVNEGQVVVDVMTEKANIELPAPTSGRVLRTSGEAGDIAVVGAELLAIETDTAAPVTEAVQAPSSSTPRIEPPPADAPAQVALSSEPAAPALREPARDGGHASPPNRLGGNVLASPSLRRQANELGIDLATIAGTGPRGRILRKDLESATLARSPVADAPADNNLADGVTEVRIIGIRRVIAERMQAAKRDIPHFAYVEEIDVTSIERLRTRLNAPADQDRLTLLAFIGLALIRALRKFPQCNALHDAQKGVLRRYSSVHLGIATQTPDGLKVPVVRNADGLNLQALAAAINTAAGKARDGSATRDDLTGSTFTLTSLGKLGGIVSTPVINAPEMGIVGVNKAVHRPMVIDGRVDVRLMMNLSSSFDHRFIDGFDAASMIQEMKSLLEEPAMLFV